MSTTDEQTTSSRDELIWTQLARRKRDRATDPLSERAWNHIAAEAEAIRALIRNGETG